MNPSGHQAKTFWPTPQQKLLLRAALWQGEKALQAWEAWQAQIDWNAYLDEGSYRLLPLLFHNLHQHGVQHPIMQKLKGIYRLAWYKNQTSFRRLAALLRAFQEAGIRTLTLKGAALTVLHYRNYGLRPMSDFDVLVPLPQAAAALTLLEQSGWTCEERLTQTPIATLLATEHAVGLKNQDGQEFDLHWHVLEESRGPGADESFWQDAVPLEVDGAPTLALNPADQLFHVCIHGARWNNMPSIRWIADAMMILRSSSSAIDWDRLLRQAQDRFLVTPTQHTLTYLHEVFAAPIPVTVLRMLQSRASSRMERVEYAYKAGNYVNKPFGYLPILWFDYLRSCRQPLTQEGKTLGFAKYLQQRWGAKRLWHLPVYVLLTSRRRIWPFTDWYQRRIRLLEKTKDKPQLPLRT